MCHHQRGRNPLRGWGESASPELSLAQLRGLAGRLLAPAPRPLACTGALAQPTGDETPIKTRWWSAAGRRPPSHCFALIGGAGCGRGPGRANERRLLVGRWPRMVASRRPGEGWLPGHCLSLNPANESPSPRPGPPPGTNVGTRGLWRGMEGSPTQPNDY